ncbi:acetate--CoA ligase family protein [Candidatus Borrarchaeum sp.]|uniref:acetate--CoA ligase family protein n=1 Tax=Candidatus Borrarchaeum sp. TaxID=2846742 RepID=UPI00257FF2DD|nr:CoA-binding protein [Candidatus Borrarchaeum sp.]
MAIIGASRNRGKIGYIILENMILQKYKGSIYPVNPFAEMILNNPVYSKIKDIPESVDLAIIALTAQQVPKIVQECGEKGIKGIIIVTGGFGETGNEIGTERENEITKIAHKYGMQIIGPNCIGIFDPYSGINSFLVPRERTIGYPTKGNIALLSQSGAILVTLLEWCAYRGIGISKTCSYGNAVDVNESDLLGYLKQDTTTKVIGMYVEGVKEGRRFYKTLREVTKAKPVIISKVGKTEAGAKASKSHTGSLAGSVESFKAMFKQTGVITAKDLEELLDICYCFATQPLPKGNNVGIITNSGGHGVLAADALENNDLRLAEFSSKTLEQLHSLPQHCTPSNPVDLAADADTERYEWVTKLILSDPQVDSVLVVTIPSGPNIEFQTIKTLVAVMKSSKKPIISCLGSTFKQFEKYKRFLEWNKIPVHTLPERAIRTLGALVEYKRWYQHVQ